MTRAIAEYGSQRRASTALLLGGKCIPVPRHTEIDDGLAEKMFRECEEVLGRRWWR
jgi:hypothetical protein